MAEFRNYQTRSQSGVMVDEGLRSHMLKVYNLMAGGVALTGIAAYALYMLTVVTDASGNITGLTGLGAALYTSPLKWVVMLAPLALVFFLSFRVHKMSVAAAQTTFWIYAALMGASLSSILLVYTQESIAQTFFITAASFGALSLYGYTTKRDLSAMGSFMVMGLFGLIIASLVNIFLQSSGLGWAISIIGVIVFAGLTAWDTQKIKEMYYEGDASDVAGRKAVMGALTLYLDFVNLFLFMLRFVGSSRE